MSQASNQAVVNTNSPAPLCYQCAYRQDAPGSAHSTCNHPCYENEATKMMSILFALGGKQMQGAIEVTANPHGVQKGWFLHPMNFDPVWLETCTGFSQKAVKA